VFTTEVNFEFGFLCIAQNTLSSVSGGGAHMAGIAEIAFRDQPDGPNIPINFGDWTSWPSTVVQQNLVSVTFGTAVGGNQSCVSVCNVFLW
jgi:hypothetical protein